MPGRAWPGSGPSHWWALTRFVRMAPFEQTEHPHPSRHERTLTALPLRLVPWGTPPRRRRSQAGVLVRRLGECSRHRPVVKVLRAPRPDRPPALHAHPRTPALAPCSSAYSNGEILLGMFATKARLVPPWSPGPAPTVGLGRMQNQVYRAGRLASSTVAPANVVSVG